VVIFTQNINPFTFYQNHSYITGFTCGYLHYFETGLQSAALSVVKMLKYPIQKFNRMKYQFNNTYFVFKKIINSAN